MEINTAKHARKLGISAGRTAADRIREAIAKNGEASIILATGASQFETLKQLTAEANIDWSKVVMFHLDEYIGLPVTSPASFRRYLQERFLSKVPSLRAVHLIDANKDPEKECKRLSDAISNFEIDVALVGIGENGHLAFNDPPANFETEDAFIVVDLDLQCRLQQLSEGWFNSLEEVPVQAISMSVRQILKSKCIICSVPDARKALAVKNSIENGVSNLHPSSILQLHPNCIYFLDRFSASLLMPQSSKGSNSNK